MTDILSEIIAHKRIEIELQKQAVSLERLQEEVAAMMQKDATAGTSVAIPVRSMKQALASSPTGIIAEFKRRSPSKGWIHETARAEEIPSHAPGDTPTHQQSLDTAGDRGAEGRRRRSCRRHHTDDQLRIS